MNTKTPITRLMGVLLLLICMVAGVSAAGSPAADFYATPENGSAPLTVEFTDLSTPDASGWAWYFGEEFIDSEWTEISADAGWSARGGHSMVVLPDGSIVLMGGVEDGAYAHDVWRSEDSGATWSRVADEPRWAPRTYHSSLLLADGSVLLIGGFYRDGDEWINYNDVWRSTTKGVHWTKITDEAPWTARDGHTTLLLNDRSIILMGGWDRVGQKNDVWRSNNNGISWSQISHRAGWPPRAYHSSVLLPDGSIVLMGGYFQDDDSWSYFNDVWRSTDNGATWTEMTSDAEWSARDGHTSVALPDGGILLMGGMDDDIRYNDLWHSADYGATWTEITPETGWDARDRHASVLLPDGSVLVTGGWSYEGDDEFTYYNDVWRLQTADSDVQNPSHLYTDPGSYSVTLRAFNTAGFSTLTKEAFITVTEPAPAETPAPSITPEPEETHILTPTPEQSPVVYAPVLLLIAGLVLLAMRKEE
ncbi:kelch repeat-containing protein [Methanocalculus sp.]|uniref:Kelch repeat-containing protein n=1 Tax=Methanocalculus sp. TaxID=2004547 RepID=UPI002610BF58|nr:kelch repeat-containing protein [Methanocalculus sp.]MDG6250226.1 kelch repeat-containing protein [Methanocalculus sp.]